MLADVEDIKPKPVAHFRNDIAEFASVEIFSDQFAVFGVLNGADARLKTPLNQGCGAENIGKF